MFDTTNQYIYIYIYLMCLLLTNGRKKLRIEEIGDGFRASKQHIDVWIDLHLNTCLPVLVSKHGRNVYGIVIPPGGFRKKLVLMKPMLKMGDNLHPLDRDAQVSAPGLHVRTYVGLWGPTTWFHGILALIVEMKSPTQPLHIKHIKNHLQHYHGM